MISRSVYDAQKITVDKNTMHRTQYGLLKYICKRRHPLKLVCDSLIMVDYLISQLEIKSDL